MTSIGFKASVILICLTIAGCFVRAPLHGEKPRPRRVVDHGPGVSERDLPAATPPTAQPAEESAAKPAADEPVGPVKPVRAASQKLVDEGQKFLDGAEYERALYKFEEAINIDPSNGEAYYYMAKTQAELGANDEADGLLDKAESLLGSRAPWGERIASLRQEIRQGAN